jgi:hypothetical protein
MSLSPLSLRETTEEMMCMTDRKYRITIEVIHPNGRAEMHDSYEVDEGTYLRMTCPSTVDGYED